ncbi:hypothetical protein [Paenibacillus sp. NPDC058174]|uniref:hypothetical protein n=1 Tax=Paenibacillus sp. NPDC058174 TaxID=3346366 RepID=UPI0036D768D3
MIGPIKKINHVIEISNFDILQDKVNVALIQELYPLNLIDKRTDNRIYSGQLEMNEIEVMNNVEEVKKTLDRISSDVNILILSEHPGNSVSIDLFQEHSNKYNRIIIARLGYYKKHNVYTNSIVIITPAEEPVFHDQISFSVEDEDRKEKNGDLVRGSSIHIFHSPFGKFTVLNCHDYTDAGVMDLVVGEDLDFIIVSSFNPATRLYKEYALSDVHRLFSFVLLSNISNYGGSGIYGPIRRKGKKGEGITVGGELFNASGDGVAHIQYQLPIRTLRDFKAYFLHNTIKEDSVYELISPPEYFRSHQPNYRNYINSPDFIKEIDLNSINYKSTRSDDLRQINIAVAQLNSIGLDDYRNHYYHFSSSPNACKFIEKLKFVMDTFKKRIEITKERVDFLIFPEVFLPQSMQDYLEDFALKFNTIIIGGFEFDEQKDVNILEDANGKNRCNIFIPSARNNKVKIFEYQKLTRSKYDALTPKNTKFKMEQGSSVYRFHHESLGRFGILICYDYSHFDIVKKINSIPSGEIDPLDILFISAYNPDASLYKHCCIADSHRFYQYVVMSNVSQFGESGVFAPIRYLEEDKRKIAVKQILSQFGSGVEGISITTVDVDALRNARSRRATDSDIFMKLPGTFQV